MGKTSERGTTKLAHLECARRGWELHETSWLERYPRPGGKYVAVKRDLLGMFDGLVFVKGKTIALQWTEDSNLSHRRNKIQRLRLSRVVRESGWEIRIWGFDLDTGALREEVAAPL